MGIYVGASERACTVNVAVVLAPGRVVIMGVCRQHQKCLRRKWAVCGTCDGGVIAGASGVGGECRRVWFCHSEGVVAVGVAWGFPRLGPTPESLDGAFQRVSGLLAPALPFALALDVQPVDVALSAVKGLFTFDLSRG